MPKDGAANMPIASPMPPMEIATPRWGAAIALMAKALPAALGEAMVLPGRGACPGVATPPKDVPANAPKAAQTALAVLLGALLVVLRPVVVPNGEVPTLLGWLEAWPVAP